VQIVGIALGGALGAVLRYGVTRAFQPLGRDAFPVGTLVANLTGALALGFLVTFLVSKTDVPPAVRLGVTAGVLGAYTTFSTFSLETLALLEDGAWQRATLYVALSVGGGIALAWLGQSLARA